MTLTPAIPRPPTRSANKAPHLFEVLDGAAPTRPLARHSLAGIDEVLLCRGDGPTREGRTRCCARCRKAKSWRWVRASRREWTCA